MAKAYSQLREQGEQALARSAGHTMQAFAWLSGIVQKDAALLKAAMVLGVGQVIRDAQSNLRRVEGAGNLKEALSRLSKSERAALEAINPITQEDIDRLNGRFTYPLHKNGVYIGLATESHIVESIAEIERQEQGLASSKDFELSVLRVLRKKRKKATDRPIDVMSQQQIDELYEKCKAREKKENAA